MPRPCGAWRVRALPCRRLRSYSAGSPFTPAALPDLALWLTAGPAWCYTDGAAGFAAASSQSLSVASNASLQTGDVDFWVAGWTRLADVASGHFLITKDGGAGREFRLSFGEGGVSDFVMRNESSIARSGTTVSANTWYFVLGWYDASTQKFSIKIDNGATVTATVTESITAGTAAFKIGGRDFFDQYHNGQLDSVAFGKAPPGGIAGIIDTLATRLYNAGAGLTYADLTTAEKTAWGLVSWYDFAADMTVDSHGTNTLTNNNGVTLAAGIARGAAGDGDSVALDTDRSTNAEDATQTTLANRATLKLAIQNGQAVLRLDGTDDYFTLPSLALTDFTVLIAAKQTGDNVLLGATAGADPQFRVGEVANKLSLYDDSANHAVSTTLNPVQGNWSVLEYVRSGSTVSFYQDGNARGTASAAGTVTLTELGGSSGGTTPVNGDVGEVIIYSSALSAADRQRAEAYLRAKWGTA